MLDSVNEWGFADIFDTAAGAAEIAQVAAPAPDAGRSADPFAILRNVGGSILDTARSWYQLQGMREMAEDARYQAQTDREIKRAGIDVQRTVALTAAEIEKTRAQATLAAAQRSVNDQTGIESLLSNIYRRVNTPQGSRLDVWMLALSAAGVYFAWRALKK